MANDFDIPPIYDAFVKSQSGKLTDETRRWFEIFYQNLIGYLSQYGMFIPQVTTSQRDTIKLPQNGQFIFNTTNVEVEVWYNNKWNPLEAGSFTFPITPTQGGTGVVSPTAHTLPVAEGSSNFNFIGPLTDGQLLIGSTGADPVAGNLIPGAGISISNASGAITISASGSGVTWTTITAVSVNAIANNGYITNRTVTPVSVVLPATFSAGDFVEIMGLGAGGWSLVCNSGQNIEFGSVSTSIAGSINSDIQYSNITVKGIVANTVWSVTSINSNPQVV